MPLVGSDAALGAPLQVKSGQGSDGHSCGVGCLCVYERATGCVSGRARA